MRIAILAPQYPSPEIPQSYAFVHTRAQLYAREGHEVGAFVLAPPRTYALDDVAVETGLQDNLHDAVRAFAPDVLAVHAPTFRMIALAERLASIPQVSWVHGHEALFSIRAAVGPSLGRTAVKVLRALPRNVHQLRTIRRFLPHQQAVVFVSVWMQEEAERHTQRAYSNAVVIPNPVDTERFTPRLDPANRDRGVAVRGLSSTKYGLDVAIRAFADARAASLTIVGSGPLEAKLRRLIERTRSRTELRAEQVAHARMPALLGDFGFFVAPSRVEAQGVAMCEAMACGLPVIASRVGGIPEFVTHMKEGLLVPPDDPETLRGAVSDLLRDPDRFTAMSKAARARMEKQCATPVVIRRELELLASAQA